MEKLNLHMKREQSRQLAEAEAKQSQEEIMAQLGTANMSVAEILGAPLRPLPRKRGRAGYRAGYTKKNGQGVSKIKRKMAQRSKQINRGG